MAAATATDGGSDEGNSSTRKTTTAATKRKTKKLHHLNHLNPQDLLSLISTVTSSTFSFLSQNDLALLPSQTLTLEFLLSSTSHSLSSLLSLLPEPTKPLSLPPQPLSSPHCWFHRFLSTASASDSTINDYQWLQVFRMSDSSFHLLLQSLSPILNSAMPAFPPNYVLGAALFHLTHGASYKAVGRRFGMDSAEACKAFFVVCKAVNDKLGHLFEFRTNSERVVVGFGWISLPNCFGVLGLESFGESGSVMVQALVDSEGRFLDVSAGWPSSMNPETILRQSKLYIGVEETKELLNGPRYELTDGDSVPQYVLGDCCFPLLPWLLTPYNRLNEEDSFSSLEREFNSVHTHAMGLVSTAFQRLRYRWGLLSKQWKQENLEFFPFVIIASCLLHNFLIRCSEPMPDDNLESYAKKEELPVFDGIGDENAQRVRDALALHLNRVSLRR